MIEEPLHWSAARKRRNECSAVEAYLQIGRSARHQMIANLKMEAPAAVDDCDDVNKSEAAGEELEEEEEEEKKDAVEEVQRLNNMFAAIRHFDQWCPFMNVKTGCSMVKTSRSPCRKLKRRGRMTQQLWRRRCACARVVMQTTCFCRRPPLRVWAYPHRVWPNVIGGLGCRKRHLHIVRRWPRTFVFGHESRLVPTQGSPRGLVLGKGDGFLDICQYHKL